jgi:putative tricarboxylic transport membrane protein
MGGMVPLLTLGIPSNTVMALLLAALMIHGIPPGPLLITRHPELFWGVVVSMFIGNIMLLALNLPLIGMWVRLLKVPYKYLYPMIILFCLIGAYSLKSKVADIVVMVIFGWLGYVMKKWRYEGAPLVLAFVLGPIMETSLRQSLIISKGSLSVFFLRPISLSCLLLAFLLLLSPMVSFFKKKRERMIIKGPT